MYNLKDRHMKGKPYTRTGDIVIACNPYQWFDDLYAPHTRRLYANALVWQPATMGTSGDPRASLEPHIYEASALAYRGLAFEGVDQSILVSGESGAGKTESVKICLHHIAAVQKGIYHHDSHKSVYVDEDESEHGHVPSKHSHESSPIVQRVLDSNPLLEAFGNAKTIRNDNSSRFGKYIQLQFDAEDPTKAAYAGKVIPSCVLAGSVSEVYLLEKSRVVQHEEDERTYHIFYQLLAAPDEIKRSFWSGLENTDNESFVYVGWTDTDTIEGKSDSESFQRTLESLALIGVEGEKLKTLMRAICIVLQLGNIVFEEDPQDSDKSIVSSTEEFEALGELMGVDTSDLLASLTIRTMRARNEEFKVPLNATHAKDSCDAFAKEIYAKAFLWLVRSINEATSAERNYQGSRRSGFGTIGLLDIFGFESFETNRFEQLCINYANEKLQSKFTHDIFRSVQQEYEAEGIELDEIKYDDNTDVLDLVEGRTGLLALLNEECVRPGGSDKGFVLKVGTLNKGNDIFSREKHYEPCVFGIRHYAGPVVYDATGFVTKNMDTLPTDLQDCARKSTNSILAKELGNESMISKDEPAKKRPPSRKVAAKTKASPKAAKKTSNLIGETVWTKFKNQLTALMSSLSTTRSRYIRCIKPNCEKKPLLMEHLPTVEQLRCAGVVAAVTISRSAFPNRLEHDLILERFISLWRKGEQAAAMDAAIDIVDDLESSRFMADRLLTTALKDLQVDHEDGSVTKAFVMGRTRTYFRAGALESLESQRLKRLGVWATEIQKIVRSFAATRKYQKLRWLTITLQALTRRRFAREVYKQALKSAIQVQCWYRCVAAARLLVSIRRNRRATTIQTHWRMIVSRAIFQKKRAAAIVVQTMVRGALQRPKFRAALHEKREEAKLENQVRALQRKLEEAEQRRIEAEKNIEARAREAMEELALAGTEEEKKLEPSAPAGDDQGDDSTYASARAASVSTPVEPQPISRQMSEQQQQLMDESGKMLEYLRKEVFKLRSQNSQMRADFDLLKQNNQRLMDANASAGASFAALNQHAKQLTRTNERLLADLNSYKSSVQKLNVTQVELKEELKMKQATYIAEVHSRLQYQKGLAKITDMVQERCRDSRLVEDILRVAEECDSDGQGGSTGGGASSFITPNKPAASNTSESGSLMSTFRSLWS